MSKMALKAELLKMLRDEMMDEAKEEGMSGMMESLKERKHGMMGDMPHKKMQATIMADDEKGLIEGAKKLPEILSKAEEFSKARKNAKKKK